MSNACTSWSEKVRSLESSGLSRIQIADAMGVAYSTVGDIANGYTKSPRGDAALRLEDLWREHRANDTTVGDDVS